MNCPYCQNQLPNNATRCEACGAQIAQAQPQAAAAAPAPQVQPVVVPPHINTYMPWAIAATILCCLPFGIVSIVYASKANSCLTVRDYVGAQQNANNARLWFWLAVSLGFVANILVVLAEIAAEC